MALNDGSFSYLTPSRYTHATVFIVAHATFRSPIVLALGVS